MAEPTSSLSYSDIETELIRRFGMSTADADAAIKQGHLWFTRAYDWSWMAPVTTLSVTSSATTTTLPDDFGGIIGHFCYASDTGYVFINQVSSQYILNLQSIQGGWSDYPQYYAIEPTPLTTSTGQRWQVRWYPIPSSSCTVSYQYRRSPDAWVASGTNSCYCPGGPMYSQLILYSALAIHEETRGDRSATYRNLRNEELARCISIDERYTSGVRWGKMTCPQDPMIFGDDVEMNETTAS